MRVYVIAANQVTAHASRPATLAPDALVVESADALKASPLTAQQLVALWRVLPDVTPVKKFRNRDTAVTRLWAAFETLPLAEAPRRGRADSKQARVITMLRRPEGASIDDIAATMGWQRHTVRGLFAGALKKKLGLTIVSDKAADGSRVYRIAEAE
jgi:hypothetical protein